MKKNGLPGGIEMIIQKAYEIHHYMFASMGYIGSVGQGWCEQFMNQKGELTIRTTQVTNWSRNKASLEGLRIFLKLCQHIIQ